MQDDMECNAAPLGRLEKRTSATGSFVHLSRSARTQSGISQSSDAHPLVEERAAMKAEHFGSAFVLRKGNPLRFAWTLLVTLLLVYTGTIFLYRLCFIDFHMTLATEAVTETRSSGWEGFDVFVTVVFWIDLFLNFLFSFDLEDGTEVDDLLRIAKYYLFRHFIINLFACIPEDFVTFLIEGGAPNQINQGVRALRLQRMSRLARLMRLSRLAKLKQQKRSGWYEWFEKQKGVRIINLVFGLAWVVHILACGWYLCAALHDIPEDTWVYRRSVDAQGHSLGESEPVDQWLHAMYFVLTVFTTVGFGDMSAVTVGEIVYVCITMGIGAVVHSIIISEVINVVMSNDQTNLFLKKQCDLVESFCSHTELGGKSRSHLQKWVTANAKHWISHKYDREEMKQIITSRSMPRALLGELPADLFGGRVADNRLMCVFDGLCNTPPRLPLLLALSLQKVFFKEGEIIYQVQDFPFSLYLVTAGTFAFIAKPTRNGGETSLAEATPIRARRHHESRSNRLRTMVKAMPKTLAEAAKSPAAAVTHLPSGKDAHKKEEEEVEDPRNELFPYVLFGPDTYFGDVEVLLNRPRKASARCESENGCVLVLGAKDFKDLSDQFPNFGMTWAQRAVARERFRIHRLAALRQGRTYRHLAATTIQAWYRSRRQASLARQEMGMSNSVSISKKKTVSMFISAAGSGTQTAHMVDQQMRMHAELRDLTRTVGVMAKQVELLTQKIGTSMPL